MKATRKTIPTLIEQRKPFKNSSGTVKAVKRPDPDFLQMVNDSAHNTLDDAEKSRFQIDNDTQGIAYVIMSFNTPIAWETTTGWVYKVSQTLSQTSEQHKGLLYLFHADTPRF